MRACLFLAALAIAGCAAQPEAPAAPQAEAAAEPRPMTGRGTTVLNTASLLLIRRARHAEATSPGSP